MLNLPQILPVGPEMDGDGQSPTARWYDDSPTPTFAIDFAQVNDGNEQAPSFGVTVPYSCGATQGLDCTAVLPFGWVLVMPVGMIQQQPGAVNCCTDFSGGAPTDANRACLAVKNTNTSPGAVNCCTDFSGGAPTDANRACFAVNANTSKCAKNFKRKVRRERAELIKAGYRVTETIIQQPEWQRKDGETGEGFRSWCAELEQKIERIGQIRAIDKNNAFSLAIDQIRGCVKILAFDVVGCRVLQQVIEKVPMLAGSVVKELQGCVREAISSPYANFVIIKVVECLPAACRQFVAKELQDFVVEMSRHRFGSRVLRGLVKTSRTDTDTATVALVEEVLLQAHLLKHHECGHRVLEAVLEHGLPVHKQRIVKELLQMQPMPNATDRNMTFVTASALKHCDDEDKAMLFTALVNQPEALVRVAEDEKGCDAIQDLLRIPGESSQAARDVLKQATDRLQMNDYGCRLFDML
jgi:hypothetical protein